MSNEADRGVHIPHAGAFGYTDWDFGFGSLNDAVAGAVMKEIERSFELYSVRATFPFIWGEGDGHNGPPVKDPLTLYVKLDGLAANEFEGPVWSFNLANLIHEDYVECCTIGLEAPFFPAGEFGRKGAIAMRDRLREVADALDEVIKRSPT